MNLTELPIVFIAYEVIWFAIFAFAFRFATKKYSKEWAITFFAPAILFGLVLEFATMFIFQRYEYGAGFLINIAGVPLIVAVAWASLMFASYHYVKQKQPEVTGFEKIVRIIIPLLLLDLLIIEPLAFIFGFWTWTPESIWFGSPIGNIIGWGMVILTYIIGFEFVMEKTKDFSKQLVYNIAMIVPRLLVLQIVLIAWVAVFGLI